MNFFIYLLNLKYTEKKSYNKEKKKKKPNKHNGKRKEK